MAGDKREVIVDLLAKDKSGPAVKGFAKGLKEAGDAAVKAGKDSEKFSRDSTLAAKGADKLGDQASEAARAVGKLDREIALASAELKVLAKSFADTGDASERLDISRAIRRGENDIRRLNKSKSLLSVDIQPKVDKQSFGKKLAAQLAAGGSSIAGLAGGAVGPTVGGAIGLAAAPVLISTLGTVISAGAGLGVIGAGIALAVKADDGIQDAGKAMGAKFVKGLSASATKNFAGPIRDSLGILDDAADRTVTKLSKSFEALGPAVVPFVRDVVQGAERLVDAFTNVASKSGPALDGLGDAIRLLSDGVGDMIETLADGGPDAAANLTLIAGATADVLRYSGLVLKMFGELANNAWVTGPLLLLLKKHYQDAADESDTLAGSNSELADSMTAAEKAAQGQQAALADLSKELLAQTDPVFGLLNASEKLKRAQEKVSDSTKKNGKDSRETKAALRDLAVAALELQGKAGALGDTFNGELTPELKNTLRAAGLTEGQIKDLAGQFKGAKKEAEKFAKNYKAKVTADTRKAVADIRAAQRIANSLDGKTIHIAMKITGNTNASAVAAGLRKQYQARAAGGPVSKNTPYWVGENGPELVLPTHDGRVLSAAASRGAVSSVGPSTGRGGGATALQLEVIGEAEMVRIFRSLIRRANLLQVGA